MRRIIITVIIATITIMMWGKEWSPEEMVNPNIANRYEYVADPDGLMDSSVKDKVNARLYNLRRQTSAEVMVAVPSDIGDTPIEEWTERLFTGWGIGKKDKDNGVLLVIAPEQRKTYIMTGYGVEGVLPDIACANIIRRSVIPAMKEGDLDAAVDNATILLNDALSDPVAAEELRSSQSDNFSGMQDTLSPEVLLNFLYIVAFTIWVLGLGLMIRDMFNARKLDNYHRARMWKSHLKMYLVLGILSLGAGLIFFAIAFLLYRRMRTKGKECRVCGSKMHRLNEEEDNQQLNDAQDLEERLNTVDYDVWECDNCGAVEKYPFITSQTKYKKCPNCGTIAMCMVEDRTVTPATVRHEGMGEKIYECRFCHHQDHERYRIPKKEDPQAALLAAAAIGTVLGRGGGGSHGGGFGGGLGGGATGGGGAGGSW